MNNYLSFAEHEDVQSLFSSCFQLLSQLEVSLKSIPEETYRASSPISDFRGGIGTHFRHLLDHFDAFFVGLGRGIINYDERGRDEQTETDSNKALKRIHEISSKTRSLSLDNIEQEKDLLVRTIIEVAPPRFITTRSSVKRELVYLLSHLVHHMAIIRILSFLQGTQLSDGFGKAISTESYEQARGKSRLEA